VRSREGKSETTTRDAIVGAGPPGFISGGIAEERRNAAGVPTFLKRY
jgi:hypothetical protein